MESESLDLVQTKLGLRFQSIALLETALTHSSYAHQRRDLGLKDNERLEFLGDAVLKLIVSDYLFSRFPGSHEGDLTKIRAKVVSDKNLARLAQFIGLGPCIRFSVGERNSGGEHKTSNLANAFEAVLGAIYLDQGVEPARHFLVSLLSAHLDQFLKEEIFEDYKTKLQEWMQRRQRPLPVYEILALEGPDHQRFYKVQVKLELNPPRQYPGEGISKKDAEQMAAKAAWQDLRKD